MNWLIALCSIPLAVSCMSAASAEIEEIVIKGRLERLGELRRAIQDTEDRIYARYNELNDDDAYDIECVERAPTGRRITARFCNPKYVGEKAHVEAQKHTDVPIGTQKDVRFATRAELLSSSLREFQRRMRDIAAKDAKMREELVERDRLEKAYRKLQREQ